MKELNMLRFFSPSVNDICFKVKEKCPKNICNILLSEDKVQGRTKVEKIKSWKHFQL